MKLRFTFLVLALLGLCNAYSAVKITHNGVYRIVNVGYNHAMKAAGAGNITCADIDETDEAQLWVAETKGDGCYMRNLKTGYYMTASRARSKAWQAQFTIAPDDNSILLNFIPTGDHFFIHTVNATGKTDDEGTHGYAHENSSRTVVGWNVNTDNTKWDLVPFTSISAVDLAAKKASWYSSVSEIEPGKAYRIRNYNYGHAMVPGKNRSLVGVADNPSDINQVWIVESNPKGEGYFLRHYETGVVVASSCLREKAWSVQDLYIPSQNASALYFAKRTSGFGFSTVSTRGLTAENADYTFAHENNQSIVLGYLLNANASTWLFSPVDNITAEDIAAKTLTWECFKKNTIDDALAAIFTDHACTELTPEYAAKSPDELTTDPNVLALPEGLRPMVRKILTGDWSETDPYNGNEWDSAHARKFRVQMIEPFSQCGWAGSLAGIQAYGDLNNPTGIVTDNGTVLYVMVEDEPAEGATLYIAGRTGEGTPLVTLNSTTDGFRLRKGLNVVPCDKDLADMIIYYTIETAGANRSRKYQLPDFQDIKIHIEGGSLNGYFNYEGDALYTPDTTEDWLYYRERARHAMFTLLSKYTTLYIHFNDIFDDNGNRTQCLKSICTPEAYAQGRYDLRATMKAWDEMYLAETLLMGFHPKEIIEQEKAIGRDYYDPLEGDPVARHDYYKYFNNRHLGITLRECGFMNATWYRTAYNPSTIASIIRDFPKGDLWGPAHEFGHLNQGPMKIAGTSEESNNVFSNVALYYRGTHSSRADYPSVQRERFNRGENFHQHGTWGTTRMWFQLWLYYHAIGHDKRFYPRLYELLRVNPLRKTKAPGHDDVVNPILAKDDLLHFAKMACVAAGEDLTDFFEAWGFFVEQDGYYIGDYTSYTAYLSAEDIAAWKAEIATMAAENGWKKNTAVIFIDDRVGSPKQSYGFDKNKCGSMGGLKDFTEGAPVIGEYTFTLAGNTIEMSGATGGVGFLIYDTDGKLIGFANDPAFTVSDAAAALLREGKTTVVAVTPANEQVKVIDAVHDGSLDQRLKAMDVLLGKVAALLSRSDPEGRKPGYLLGDTMADLHEAYNQVMAKREAGEINEANNVELYDMLFDAFTATGSIEATADNTVQIVPGGIYVFTSNILYPGKGITANDAGNRLANVAAGSVDMDNPAQQWVFEPADEENYYYIRNMKFNKYIGKAPADKGIVTLESAPVKQLVLFREFGGLSISPLGSDHDSLHDDGYGRLTRWDSSAKASRWGLTLVSDWEVKAALAELLALVARAEQLLAQAGTITETADGVTAEPKADYPFVTPDMMTDLYALVKAAEEMAEAGDAEAEAVNALADEIALACDELSKALTRNHDRLVELIEKTRELAAIVGNYTEEITPVTLTGDNMYSNAPHTAAGSDKFTTWDVLFDNNHNTFFHSSYQNANTPDGLDHYIRISLPEVPQQTSDFIFSYVTRKNNDSNWMPAEATLEYSADGESWHTIAELSDELAVGSAYLFESEPFSVPAGTQYIRFMVHKNRQSTTNAATKKAGGHCFFVLSEMGLYDYDLSCEALTAEYPSSDAGVIRAALIRARAAEQVLARRDYGLTQYDAAYEALLPHYEALMAIYDDPAGIDSITIGSADDLRDPVIYNLRGIRLNKITTPGIYIINGRKVMVR